MTSISGITIVETPCCKTQYSKTTYASVSSLDWHQWSDEFCHGRLYSPPSEVYKCGCGTYFLLNDAKSIGQLRFRDEGYDEKSKAYPRMPYLKHTEIIELIQGGEKIDDRKIEYKVRMKYWWLLNHRYRVFSEELKDHTISIEQWDNRRDEEIEDLAKTNMLQLLPLIEEFDRNNLILRGEAWRVLGEFINAIDCYKKSEEFNRTNKKYAEHLISLAQDGVKRVVRMIPQDWKDPLKKPAPYRRTIRTNELTIEPCLSG